MVGGPLHSINQNLTKQNTEKNNMQSISTSIGYKSSSTQLTFLVQYL